MQSLTQHTHKSELAPQLVGSSDSGPHTSIFLPVTDDDSFTSLRIKFRALIDEAKQQLSRLMKEKDVQAYIQPIEESFASYKLSSTTRGIAFFRSLHQTYHTPLNIAPPPLVVVANSFHVKPLMHCVSTMSHCYAVVVTNRLTRVFLVNGSQASPVAVYENEFDSEETHRQSGSGSRRRRAKDKDVLEQYVRSVGKQIARDLNLRHRHVAVLGSKSLRKRLAANLVDKAQAHVFFESTSYSSIEEMAFELNSRMRMLIYEESQLFAERLAKSDGRGMITHSLEHIAEAAVQGRVERLVIDPSVQVWGLFDRTNGLVSTHVRPHSEAVDCIVDDIAEEVICKGGEVVFFDSSPLEKVGPYMATLRW